MRSGSWTFSGMGDSFDAHVAEHLPGYADVQDLVALVATFVLPNGGTHVDLGASTGITATKIRRTLPSRGIKSVLYDNDQSMLRMARTRLGEENAEYITGELPESLKHDAADLTTALWLFQFMAPRDWVRLLAASRARSAPNGCLILAAKTRHVDPRWDDVAAAALDDYKAAAGVTASEREKKTRALRGVLHQAPVLTYTDALERAGWVSPVVLWRWHVWSVIGAFASPLPVDRWRFDHAPNS